MTSKISLKAALVKRHKNLKKALEKQNKSSYLFEDPHDLFYLTGIALSKGMLLFSCGKMVLFVDGRYRQVAESSKLCKVASLTDKEEVKAHFKELLKGGRSLCFDAEKTSFSRYQSLKKIYSSLTPFENPLKHLRACKDSYEIKKIESSAKILVKAFEYVEKQLKVGMTEKELSNLMESYILQEGGDTVSFRPIVAFNKNSAMPHHKTGKKKLTLKTLVLIDCGVYKEGYASDMTRVFFFRGKEEKQERIYRACKKVLETVLQEVKAGVSIKKLALAAKQVVKQEGFDEIPHSLGHGIGLEVHEYPILAQRVKATDVLKENMIITIEPGIYDPKIGGVRLEEMLLVTKTGYKNFYNKFPV